MKKAVILCNLDGYANSSKPTQLKKFLEKRGYTVELYPTMTISRSGSEGFRRLLPHMGVDHLKLYFLEALQGLAERLGNKTLKKLIISAVLQPTIGLRGRILANTLRAKNFDLLICENNLDEAVVRERVATIQLLDLPSPLAEESFYGGELDPKKFGQLKAFEKDVYAKADHLSFHWYTYSDFVKKEKYDGDNFIRLEYGTTPKQKVAHFSKTPKIVFLGYLSGYWVNLPLLEKLSELYPDIHVYGGPEIAGLKVNYKGYAPTTDVLAEYQFGLITISDDPLRRSSFSSKHVEYFSYGLPVLVPDWRTDALLDPGSIHYGIENFVALVHSYSDREKWEAKSKAALFIANQLTWEKGLAPLSAIIGDDARSAP